MSRLRIMLWQMGLLESSFCPVCKAKLLVQGFKEHNARYTCPECKFEGSEL